MQSRTFEGKGAVYGEIDFADFGDIESMEPAYSFKIYEGDDGDDNSEPQIYYFDVADNQNPRPHRLGDGTFGAVYRVRRNNRRYALKIFYETPDQTARRRFKEEMNAASSILAGSNLQGLANDIVLPRGRTGRFKESRAYRDFKDYFDRSNLSVSDFALVMDLYSCTLKELLERGAPSGRGVHQSTISQPGVPGYQILGDIDYADRERVILPFILKIAQGLHELHASGYHHHDLKPANVLVREAGVSELHVHIGDLGFLNPNVEEGSNSRFGEGQALGTRHYRSPEQKDHFDVCEVDIEEIPKGIPGQTTVLTTRDRKFGDTLIESGDTLVFSKDAKRTVYKIHQIVPDRIIGPGDVVRDIESLPDQEMGMDPAAGRFRIILDRNYELEPEERTQIILYKRHTARTDVFGLGAIIFDLLTGGSSPERFYDLIRVWDHKEAGPIKVHVGRFSSIKNGATSGPEESARFQPLVDNGKYPSERIISIMLRCMLSAPEDSYVEQADSLDDRNIFGPIIADIEDALQDSGRLQWNGQDNPLWIGEELAGSPERASGDLVRSLEKVQNLGERDLARRLVLGYILLRQVVHAAEENVTSKEVFFADISPPNISGSSNTGRRYITQDEYWDKVAAGDAYGIPSDPHDPFVPVMLNFRSRPVKLLCPVPDGYQDDQAGSERRSFSVVYKDSCPLWQGIEAKDLLLINTSPAGARKVLAEVTEYLPNRTEIQVRIIRSDDNPLPSVPPNGLDAVVIKSLRPVEYYLSMIGVYIHQLFLVNDRVGGGLPSIIYEFLQAKYCGSNQRFTRNSAAPLPQASRRKSARVDDIFEYLSRLYAWLICRDYREGPELDYDTLHEQAMLAELDEPIYELRELIFQVVAFRKIDSDRIQDSDFSFGSGTLDRLTVEQIEDYEWNLTSNLTSSEGSNQLATLDSCLARIRRKSGTRFGGIPFARVRKVASAPFGQKRH
jgi:serine/threonine protein kinase